MLKMHACRTGNQSNHRSKYGWIPIVLILCVAAFGQQSQREFIHMGGKTVAVEASAFSAPSIAIASPTSGSSYTVFSKTITLAGAASDASGISEVSWVNSRGGSGACSGAGSWTCSGIGLIAGLNVLTVTARDKQSSYAVDTLTVNYCEFKLAPSRVTIAAGGGTGAVSNTCSENCSWSSTSNAAWIVLTDGVSGVGSGTIGYSVAANTGPARSGIITIAGRTFTINQASGCTYALNPAFATYPVAGGTGTINVTTAGSCPKTVENSLSWVSITGGSGSNGSGPLTYTVAPNDIPARSGTMMIGNAGFSISQESNPYCGDGICQEGSAAACPSDCSSCDQSCAYACVDSGLPWYYCLPYCGCSQ